MNEQECAKTLGELIAYRVAFDAAIKAHPRPSFALQRLQRSREAAVALCVAEPWHDAVLQGFESAWAALEATIRTTRAIPREPPPKT